MFACVCHAATVGLLAMVALPAAAADLKGYLNKYFAGAAIEFGYGAGVSSSRPRVDLLIHYCPSGAFFSSGRSCRPNIFARGDQCTPLQDAGRWRIVTQGNIAALQWVSNRGNSGGTRLLVRRDGVVVDPQGNLFRRVGRARCR